MVHYISFFEASCTGPVNTKNQTSDAESNAERNEQKDNEMPIVDQSSQR